MERGGKPLKKSSVNGTRGPLDLCLVGLYKAMATAKRLGDAKREEAAKLEGYQDTAGRFFMDTMMQMAKQELALKQEVDPEAQLSRSFKKAFRFVHGIFEENISEMWEDHIGAMYEEEVGIFKPGEEEEEDRLVQAILEEEGEDLGGFIVGSDEEESEEEEEDETFEPSDDEDDDSEQWEGVAEEEDDISDRDLEELVDIVEEGLDENEVIQPSKKRKRRNQLMTIEDDDE
jgi:hypothetical protein